MGCWNLIGEPRSARPSFACVWSAGTIIRLLYCRSLARALFFIVLPLFPYLFIYGANPKEYLKSTPLVHYLTAFAFYLVLGLMFSTARRRNGFAGVHDLLTRTRVTSRAALLVRPGLAVVETPPPQAGQNMVLGPYHILEDLGQSPGGQWLLGYDLRLLRKVWIRTVPAGTPPVPITVRNIGRIGRLRWLTGRRSAEENWDAFEAPTGKPLLAMAGSRQPWSQVRFWLHDLASEINAAEKEGSLPLLALDRVWITGDGRAKLLDFPPPGIPECPDASEVSRSGKELNAQLFLSEVVTQALGDPRKSPTNAPAQPLPIHARAFLKSMSQTLDAGAVAAAIKPLLQRVPEVSRWRRAAVLFGCIAFPVLACVGLIFGQRMLDHWRRSNPALIELHQLLSERSAMNSRWVKGPKRPTDQQYAIYIAHHYAPLITNDVSWSSTIALSLIKGETRRFAERSVAENPAPTEAEITEALDAVGPKPPASPRADPGRQPWFPLMVLAAALVMYVGLPALIAALLFRGGLVLLAVGITFVRRDGERASRLRAFWRAVVAWSPVAIGVVMARGAQTAVGRFWRRDLCQPARGRAGDCFARVTHARFGGSIGGNLAGAALDTTKMN